MGVGVGLIVVATGEGVGTIEISGAAATIGAGPRNTSPGISLSPTAIVISALPLEVAIKLYIPTCAGCERRPR